MTYPFPTKARIVPDVERSDYEMRFTIRHRRPWAQMKDHERQAVLEDAAAQLEIYAAQMREEAEMLANKVTF